MTYENETLSKVPALADVATGEDRLFRDGYVKGAAEFIKTCPTPMTIAIQGDWGAGKTSLINLIEKELRAEEASEEDSEQNDSSAARKYCDDIINVAMVDVYDQSVANPRASLLEDLLFEVLLKLAGADRGEAVQFAELASAASQLVGMLSGGGDKGKDDSFLGSIFDALFEPENNSKGETTDEYISSKDIEAFRTSFADALSRSAQEGGKSRDSRFVVFVDGLDHIDPEATVSLIEQIKTYLDCPRCLFVLALDQRVVFDGVRKKFGDKVDESRKKAFFDKHVQVPFHIPTSTYNLDKYIKDLLGDGENCSSEFVAVISTLLKEPTPLGIKRYLNTMSLCRSTFGESEGAEGNSLAMLLAAVILELESAQGFSAVADCAQGDEAHFDENLQVALDSLDLKDQINVRALPSLWSGGESAGVDAAKRSAFISWVRKLK